MEKMDIIWIFQFIPAISDEPLQTAIIAPTLDIALKAFRSNDLFGIRPLLSVKCERVTNVIYALDRSSWKEYTCSQESCRNAARYGGRRFCGIHASASMKKDNNNATHR